MNALLFVYGSLMPQLTTAFGRHERERLQRESHIAGPAIVAGRLFDLGDYPGLYLSREGDGPQDVHGVLLSLSAPVQTFSWLDLYEDIVPGRPAGNNTYARIEAPIRLGPPTTTTTTTHRAWVYVLQHMTDDAKELTSGRWHGRRI